MAGAKRTQEFEVSNINEEMQSAVVHGRVMELSPVKSSRKNQKLKFFDCTLTYEKEICRVVSFEPKIRSELEECMEKGHSVSLVNCGIKKSKVGTGYELIVSDKSTVMRSPKKFKVSDDMMKKASRVCELDRIEKIDVIAANAGNKVCIRGKVVSIYETKDCSVFTKRACVISDESRACRLVLWEELVDLLETSKCYIISNVSVKSL